MSKTTYFILIAFVFAGISCKKDEINSNGLASNNPCSYTYYIDSDDLENSFYSPGSYWIQIDSVNLTIDSVAIISLIQPDLGLPDGDCMEGHSFSTISYPSLDSMDFSVLAGGVFKNLSGTFNFSTPVNYGYDRILEGLNPNVITYDSLFVYDRYYKEVVQCKISPDITENSDSTIYYMNSDYGFLRQDVYSGGILISNKVVMNQNIVR